MKRYFVSGISEETVQLHCPARSPDIDCTVSTSTDSVPTTVTTTSTANQTVYGDTSDKNGTDNGILVK